MVFMVLTVDAVDSVNVGDGGECGLDGGSPPELASCW